MAGAFWQRTGHSVILQFGEMRAAVDLAQPRHGLGDPVVAGQNLATARLLGVATSPKANAADAGLIEDHVRGSDLAVAYEESEQPSMRVDVLWRATPPSAMDRFLAAVDLIVSVRTELLHRCCELSACSSVPSTEVLRLRDFTTWTPLSPTTTTPVAICPEDGTGCLLLRFPGLDLTYVEMIHPADFQHDTVGGNGPEGPASRITHHLFRTNLEKGVILRARVRGVFLSSRDDAKVAAQCYAAFAAAAPPLST